MVRVCDMLYPGFHLTYFFQQHSKNILIFPNPRKTYMHVRYYVFRMQLLLTPLKVLMV